MSVPAVIKFQQFSKTDDEEFWDSCNKCVDAGNNHRGITLKASLYIFVYKVISYIR